MAELRTLDPKLASGQRVLMRVDFNVPVKDGVVLDDTRIHKVLPDIQRLLAHNAKVVLISHFGRPKGCPASDLSLAFLVEILAEKIGKPVLFSPDCVGKGVESVVSQMKPGEVLLLENLRFDVGETENDYAFAENLSRLGDIYVNNAFSVSHRAHSSVDAITHFLPSYAGGLLAQEFRALSTVTEDPKTPVMGIVGGSKVSTKIGVLRQLVQKLDILALGGGIAHTFILAKGGEIGASICEPDAIELATQIISEAQISGTKLLIPVDAVVVEDLERFSGMQVCDLSSVQPNHFILDMGPQSIDQIAQELEGCRTVLWNGPVGLIEKPPFDQGSLAIADLVAKTTQQKGLFSVAGGGETVAVINKAKCFDKFSYVSTAGGAFLEFLEGKSLPGLQVLLQGTERTG